MGKVGNFPKQFSLSLNPLFKSVSSPQDSQLFVVESSLGDAFVHLFDHLGILTWPTSSFILLDGRQ